MWKYEFCWGLHFYLLMKVEQQKFKPNSCFWNFSLWKSKCSNYIIKRTRVHLYIKVHWEKSSRKIKSKKPDIVSKGFKVQINEFGDWKKCMVIGSEPDLVNLKSSPGQSPPTVLNYRFLLWIGWMKWQKWVSAISNRIYSSFSLQESTIW